MADTFFIKLNTNLINKLKEKIKLYEFVYSKTRDRNINIIKDFEYKKADISKINLLNKLIDRNNSVLIRCLYYFAKACSFVPNKMTMEESTALQMFCLDGLTKLIIKKYDVKKISDLDSFLKDKFACPYGEYLKDLHDERTIYVHPSNIHGEYWCPPWDADTCIDTIFVTRDMILLYLEDKFKPSDSRWNSSLEEMGYYDTKK